MNENVTKITSPLLIVGKNSKQQLDARYGPYGSIDHAYNILGPDYLDCIFVGLTVGILQTNGEIEEYWFKGGTDKEHLVQKNDTNLIWNK